MKLMNQKERMLANIQIELYKDEKNMRLIDLYLQTENEIQNLLKIEELRWSQRARADWIRLGDQNTKFFQARVRKRRSINQINKIQDSSGLWLEEEEQIVECFMQEFKRRFQKEQTSMSSNIIDNIPHKVSEEHN